MPCRYGVGSAHRLRVELIEADVEIGFSLVDMAESSWQQGQRNGSSRLLADAEDVCQDISQRLRRLESEEIDAFTPLFGELRRAIEAAKLHCGPKP